MGRLFVAVFAIAITTPTFAQTVFQFVLGPGLHISRELEGRPGMCETTSRLWDVRDQLVLSEVDGTLSGHWEKALADTSYGRKVAVILEVDVNQYGDDRLVANFTIRNAPNRFFVVNQQFVFRGLSDLPLPHSATATGNFSDAVCADQASIQVLEVKAFERE